MVIPLPAGDGVIASWKVTSKRYNAHCTAGISDSNTGTYTDTALFRQAHKKKVYSEWTEKGQTDKKGLSEMNADRGSFVR
jgi:hypothetical protein